MRPFGVPFGQQLGVRINGTVVGTATVTTNEATYHSHIKGVVIEAPAENLTLSLKQMGTPRGGYGILVSNIKMQKLVPTQDSTLEGLTNSLFWNNMTDNLNSLPGSRIFLSSILGFLSAFDRLQFYYFHRQNLSFYSEKLLSNVNKMAL